MGKDVGSTHLMHSKSVKNVMPASHQIYILDIKEVTNL